MPDFDFSQLPDQVEEPLPPQEVDGFDLSQLPDQPEAVIPEWSPADLPEEVDGDAIKNAQAIGAMYNVDPFAAFISSDEIESEINTRGFGDFAKHVKSILKPVPALAASGVLEAAAGAAGFLGIGAEEKDIDVITGAGHRQVRESVAEKFRGDVRLVEAQIMKEDPLERGSWSEATRNAFVSIYTQAPAFGVGLLLKARAFALGILGAQAGLQKGSQLQEEGFGKGTAFTGAVISGTSEALTEMIPFGAFMDILKKSPGMGKNLVRMFLGEQIGEQINTVVDSTIDKLTIAPDMTWDEYLQRVEMTAKATIIQTGIMGGTAASVSYAVEHGEMQRVIETMPEDVKTSFDEAKSEAQANGADDIKATVQALNDVEKTPEGKAHIESETATIKDERAGIEPVPTIEEVFQKITQEDLTEEQLGEFLDTFAGGALQEEIVSAPVAEIKQRLLDVGMDEVEASSNAALFDGFRVLAERAGVSTEEVISRFLPQIAKEGAAPAVEVTDAERIVITGNQFLGNKITTEEQLSNVEYLQNTRDDISQTLREDIEDLEEIEVAQMNEAVSFINQRLGALRQEVGAKGTIADTEKVAKLDEREQAAFHGTPHKFDKFTLDHIGAGEGAQAFGWGLYFAESKDVAQFYAESGRGSQVRIAFNHPKFDGKHVVLDEEKVVSKHTSSDAARKALNKYVKSQGRVVKVELAPAEGEWLAWDKDITQEQLDKIIAQGEGVLSAHLLADFRESALEEGEKFYKAIAKDLRSDKAASLFIKEAGIPGIKYLDQASRGKFAHKPISAKERTRITERLDQLQRVEIPNAKTASEAKSLDAEQTKLQTTLAEADADLQTSNFVVFDEELIQIEEFLQPGQEAVTPEAEPRGRIRFAPTGIDIELLKNADKSTFVHETGHLYLRVLQELSGLESASPDLKADFESVSEWLGVTEEQNGEMTVEQEEKFARGFETYLREGKAPTPALAEAFENFKQWLVQVYQSLRDLNVELTPEVRGVMDRMLADEGVEVAEREGVLPVEPIELKDEVFAQAAVDLQEQRKKDLQSSLGDDIFNIEETKRRIDNELYIHDRIPEEISESEPKGRLKDAQAIARRSLESVSENDAGPIHVNRNIIGRRSELAGVRKAEAKALKAWAEKNNLILKGVEKAAASKKKLAGGQENYVFYSPSKDVWVKANRLEYTPTYNDLFDRVMLHNNQFPDTPYTFKGFATVRGEFMPVFTQKNRVNDAGITDVKKVEMAADYLQELGYEKNPANDRQWVKGDIVVQDIHAKNISVQDGKVFIFDPVIFLNPETKSDRVTGESIEVPGEQIGEEVDLEGLGIEGVEVLEQAPKITNIRQLAKSLGGIDFNREHLKGELIRLKENAPATKLIINKKDEGVTLDGLLEAAIEANILSETSTLDDVLNALEINLQTGEAIQEEIDKEERIRRGLEAKEFKLGELKKAFVDASIKARKAFREGKKVGEIKEAQKLKKILARVRKVRQVRDYFNLTDTELKKISRKNPLLLSQYEFKLYLDQVRYKAAEVEEKALQKAILMNTIYEKDLGKVDNYRRALGLPTISKMTTNQLVKFNEALEPFYDGDVFLSERELQTVDRTDLEGVKTWREAKEALSKETGVSIEDLETIKVKEWDEYKWDTSLAETNPFYKMLITETSRKLLEAEMSFHEVENEVFRLARASEKSRNRTFIEKAIPQDPQIMAYLETPVDERGEIAAGLTPAQLDYAHYIESYFQIALEYLIKIKALERGRQNYFVHMRKSFLENVKDNGLKRAFKDIFKTYQEDEATFNIMDDDTGNILPLEKFFQFTLRRTGGIDPTTNVTKAFLAYAQMMEKKISLDELIPKMDIYAQSLTPEIYTPRGLEIDRSLKKFVNKFINNKKGRRIRWIAKQGGTIDVSIRGLRTFTTVMDLGLNIPSGVAAFVGEQATNFEMLGIKGYTKGTARIKTKKGKAIIAKYEAFLGRSAWEEFTAPGQQVTERISTALFGLFHEASVLANKQFLLGAITQKEYDSGEITSERLAIVKTEMGRFRVVPSAKSMVGSTSAGSAMMQYKTWAAPIVRTLSKDATTLVKDLAKKPVGEALTTREAREIYRFIGLTAVVLIVGAFSASSDDDESFVGQLLKRVYRESMTLLGGVDPSLWAGTPRIMTFLKQLANNLTAIAKLEEYKTKPGLKGVSGLQKQLTPRALKQFDNKKEARGR